MGPHAAIQILCFLLGLVEVLGFIIQKRLNLNFDPTLTRDLRPILKSLVCFGRSRGELSNSASRGSIRSLVLEIARGGASIPPRPPGGRGYGNSPGGAGLTGVVPKTPALRELKRSESDRSEGGPMTVTFGLILLPAPTLPQKGTTPV